MTYICHDTAKTTFASSAVDWLSTLWAGKTADRIDIRNQHLLRDAGLSGDYSSEAVNRDDANRGSRPVTFGPSTGSGMDMYINQYINRGAFNY